MKKSVILMLHLLFWIFTSLLILLVFQVVYASSWVILQSRISLTPMDHLKGLTIVLPLGACIFYASYFSFPFFARRSMRFAWLFIVLALLLVAGSIPGYLAQKAAQHAVSVDHTQGLLSTTLIVSPVLYFIVLGFLFSALIEWLRDRKIKAELERDKMASQLELLSTKMNPHFLFNTLNNIDVLVQDDPALASEYLRKLSDLLRFMLYESHSETISLEQELVYIRKYLDLQRIRTGNASFVKLELTGDAGNKRISPMILVHFIENAFKYATNKKVEEAIVIGFEILPTKLRFTCRNHIAENTGLNSEGKGIGIRLLKQKLELLYKNDYTLHANEENNWYLVHLEIGLK